MDRFPSTPASSHLLYMPAQGRSDPPDSAAIVLLSAVGDVVHGMPLPTSLKAAWPECRVTWVIEPGPHELVAPHPDVDEFLVFRRGGGSGTQAGSGASGTPAARPGPLACGDAGPLAAARGFLDFRRRVKGRNFDLVLDPQVYLKAGLLTGILDAPVKVGFDRARSADLNGLFLTHRLPPRPPGHVQEMYFEFLEWLDVPPVREWRFAFSGEERRARRAFFDRLDRPALAACVKSSERTRDWIPERWARLLEAAEFDLGLRPVLVGSEAPAERAVADEVLRRTRAEPVDALRNDLRRLAWILDGSALAVSPDTGPLHVADALGTPVVGLYGATDPRRAGPYREEFRALAVDRYGGEGPPSREKKPGRMRRITVRGVVERLEEAVRRYVRSEAPESTD